MSVQETTARQPKGWLIACAILALFLALWGAGVVLPHFRGDATSGKPFVSLVRADWLALPAHTRTEYIHRVFDAQCHGVNRDAETDLAVRTIDNAYRSGSSDTPVRLLIDYLDTSPLICWGAIGGYK